MTQSIIARVHSEKAASMVEYAFLLVLIAMVAFVAVQALGPEVSTSFSSVSEGFEAGS